MMMSPCFAVSLLLTLLLLPCVTPEPPKEEKDALINFIEAVGKHFANRWNHSHSPCSWRGVICDPTNTTVIQLSLRQEKLEGNIPNATIGNLHNLLVLSLSLNSLTGSIPYDFSCLELNELYLDSNEFSGNIPYIYSNMLDRIDLSGNNLSCRIPFSLQKFPINSFSGNNYLCGYPLSAECNSSCPYSYSSCYSHDRAEIRLLGVGASVGVVLLVLIILCCFRKKIRNQIKQPRKQSLEAPDIAKTRMQGEGNKLELFDDDGNYNGLGGWNELVQGSAEVLGRGSVGTSYKRVLEEKITVVLKRLKDVSVTKTEFESQMEVLGKMKNEHVVPLRGHYYSKDEQWLVYDYMDGGSLSTHLSGLRGAQLNWNHRKRIALSAARGVAYLHVNNVVHGNIKSSNVLLQQEPNQDASVSDYGLNTLFDTCSSPNHWVTRYWAPEVLKTQKFSLKSDVYSFGVLLLELLTGKSPDQASTDWNDFLMWVHFVVCEEPKVKIFDTELTGGNMKEMLQMVQIAKDCVSIVPGQRPTMLKVVSMMEEMETVETVIRS